MQHEKLESYLSSCRIRVRHFPFDVQRCEMQFQSWVYPRNEVQLNLLDNEASKDDFTESGEWNIVSLPGKAALSSIF